MGCAVTVAFIGHRNIDLDTARRRELYDTVRDLIECENADTFLFGSRSRFDDCSLGIVTELKCIYPSVKRVYVRAEYPVISEDYKKYLLRFYDDTFFPESILNAGKAIYLERNRLMIDLADVCIFYCDTPRHSDLDRSGTYATYRYALSKKKRVINMC